MFLTGAKPLQGPSNTLWRSPSPLPVNKSGPPFWGTALGEITVVMTCGTWKRASVFPGASHRDSPPPPTFLGGMWLLFNLPLGCEQDWAEVGKNSRGVAATSGAPRASEAGKAQPRHKPES